MTRVNLGIAPDELCDQWLLAEWRELPRVRWSSRRLAARWSGELPPRVPREFTLNKGHELCLAPYGLTLALRHVAILKELRCRGIAANVSLILTPLAFPAMFRAEVPRHWHERGRGILLERLRQRLAERRPAVPRWGPRGSTIFQSS